MWLIKRMLLKILINFKLFPIMLLSRNPFKLYEFSELLKNVEFSRDGLILDIGCGYGLHAFHLGRRCKKVIGIDISVKAIEGAVNMSKCIKTSNAEFRCSRIEDAEFKDGYFDKVFSICVLQHIYNYKEVLKEVYRVLKKNGHMILSVDSLEIIEDENLLQKHKNDHCVEKYFRETELKESLQDAGFNRISIYPILKSGYAKELFIEGIKNKFQYRYLRTIISYIFLRYIERKYVGIDKGLFLIAKCSK